MSLFLVVDSIGRRNETLSPTSIIELNTKSEIPIRNKVTNFQKIEMIAAKIKPKLGGAVNLFLVLNSIGDVGEMKHFLQHQ